MSWFRDFFDDPDPSAPGGPALARRPWLGLAGLAVVLGLWMQWVESFDLVDALLFQARRRDAADPILRAAIAAAAYGTGLVGLTLCCCHASRWVRVVAWALLFVGTATVLGWKNVNDVGFTIHEARLFWRELEYAPEALAFFFGRYALAVGGVLAVTIALAAACGRWAPRVRPWWVCIVPVAGFGLCQWVHETSFAKIDAFPSPYRVAVLLSHARSDVPPYFGPREDPDLEPSVAPAADHIVLIVDESVSGDLLGINGGPADTTPFLSSIEDRMASYGVASAISNVSSTTNIILQSGLRADELPDLDARSLRSPNLFGYMARAGFATFYVDAQTYGEPSNFMTRYDVDALDGFLQIIPLEVGTVNHEIDRRIVEHLVRIVEEHPRSFSYVLKAGAHLHYEGRYPDSERVFEPTLEPGELSRFEFTGADRERTLNSYLNAMRWSVDGFWSELLPRLDATGRSVLLLYTSDHGQSILEPSPASGRPERLSHNTRIDPPVFQAMVPLFLVGTRGGVGNWLAGRFAPSLRDRVSQFAVFPTLLGAAGYDSRNVRDRYGPSLFDEDAADGPRHFVSGDLFGRDEFGWNAYAPEPRPPASTGP